MAADQFCLRWNNFQVNIISALEILKSDGDLVDVTLSCEGRSVKAHKVILSACSPYFRNVFKENPCKHPVVILKDVKFEDLTALLNFMYNGEVYITQDRLSPFLHTAELLQVRGLAGAANPFKELHPLSPTPHSKPQQQQPAKLKKNAVPCGQQNEIAQPLSVSYTSVPQVIPATTNQPRHSPVPSPPSKDHSSDDALSVPKEEPMDSLPEDYMEEMIPSTGSASPSSVTLPFHQPSGSQHSGIHKQSSSSDDLVGSHPCPFCCKVISNKSNLTKHIRIRHSGDCIQQQCQQCGKFFKNKYSRKVHEYTYHRTQQPQFECSSFDRTFEPAKA